MDTPPDTPLRLAGPAGDLEARWRATPAEVPVRAVALLCPPHPLFGGTLHNKTLFRLAKRLSTEAAVASLRFNFRGAGESEGTHDGGRGEVDDARTALGVAAERAAGRPLVVAGFSFGAAVGLRAALDDPRVTRLVALGTPLRTTWGVEFLRSTDKPVLFVQGEQDEFGPGPELEAFADTLTSDVRTCIVPGADHLFTGQEDAAVDAVIEYIRAHC